MSNLEWDDPYRPGIVQGMASTEIIKERLTICTDCVKNKLNFCTDCGCFIPFKIRIETSKCPEKKW
jgi:hypothetical protein